MATQQLTIPMFPLNLVILPGETKPLHIFEERYKQLVNDCIVNNAHFGIPFVQQKSIGNYGIEVRIKNIVKTYDNGEMDIMVEGIRVFKMLEFSQVLTPKLYGAGVIKQEEDSDLRPSHFLQELIKEYLWVAQQNTVPIDAFDNTNIYGIARLVELSNQEKYDLIKAATLNEKEMILREKLKLFIHLIKTENELKSRFIFN